MAKSKLCAADNHNYQEAAKSDHRVVEGLDTVIYRSFFCNKCGDVIQRKVMIWKDFIPGKQKTVIPKAESSGVF